MDVLPVGYELGPYKIIRVAGRGAVGVVYEAEHAALGKKVAVKTLNKVYAGEEIFRERFDREAKGAAAVDHPNIVSVFDAGADNGVPYLVMNYVDGPDLERILKDLDGPLDVTDALLICGDIAEALDAAAAKGLSHRDVKPANILVEGWGDDSNLRVYLTDFGLTKHSAAATITKTGQFVGTLLYMAPEQIEGSSRPASDQYSLACVLWECLTGGPPFLPSGGSNLSLLTAHLTDPIPDITKAAAGPWSAELGTILSRGLAKKADERYPSCGAFIEAARRALGVSKEQGRAPGTSPRGSRGNQTSGAAAAPVPAPSPAKRPAAPKRPAARGPAAPASGASPWGRPAGGGADAPDEGPAPKTAVISAEDLRQATEAAARARATGSAGAAASGSAGSAGSASGPAASAPRSQPTPATAPPRQQPATPPRQQPPSQPAPRQQPVQQQPPQQPPPQQPPPQQPPAQQAPPQQAQQPAAFGGAPFGSGGAQPHGFQGQQSQPQPPKGRGALIALLVVLLIVAAVVIVLVVTQG